MNKRFGLMALLFLALPVMAHASCDEVKSSIDAKIKANGVSNYKLEVVSGDNAADAGGKVVGNCEGDKKIVYTRGEGGSSDSASSDSSAAADASSTPAPEKKHHHAKKAADDASAPAPAASSGG